MTYLLCHYIDQSSETAVTLYSIESKDNMINVIFFLNLKTKKKLKLIFLISVVI